MAIISTSEIKTFKSCRVQWNFSSPQRLGLRPKIPKIYFLTGAALHEALDKYYGSDDSNPWEYFAGLMEQYVNENRDTLLEEHLVTEWHMGEYLLKAYVRWAKIHDDFEVLGTEERHTLELPNGHTFTFKFDGLVQKKDGSIWLKEFKTTQQLPSTFEYLQFDDQAIAYQWAASKVLDLPITGTIYTYLRKKSPTPPKVLKSGKVSENARIVTTVEAFYEGLIEQGFNPADYEDFLQTIKVKEGEDYFSRVEVLSSNKQREIMGRQIESVISEMVKEDVLIYPNASQINCSRCHFRDPCVAAHLGANYKHLLENDYEEGGYY